MLVFLFLSFSFYWGIIHIYIKSTAQQASEVDCGWVGADAVSCGSLITMKGWHMPLAHSQFTGATPQPAALLPPTHFCHHRLFLSLSALHGGVRDYICFHRWNHAILIYSICLLSLYMVFLRLIGFSVSLGFLFHISLFFHWKYYYINIANITNAVEGSTVEQYFDVYICKYIFICSWIWDVIYI